MRIVLIFLSLMATSHLLSQSFIQGKVIDSATQQALANVSIFISSTSVGTISKADGSFSLNIPQGKYEVVFSYVGYTKKAFSTSNVKSPLIIQLSQAENLLDDVILIPFEKNGWQKWGKFFTDIFIGTTEQADQCKIHNSKAIKFRYDKKNKILKAVALEPLIIVNKALGYNLRFELEDFVFDFNKNYSFYEGYPLFTELEGNIRQQKRWKQRRKNVYEGSQMHFLRSVYRNTIIEEGFDVYRMQRKENVEKKRIKEFLKNNRMPNDSSEYFDNILSQPDEKRIIYSDKLTGDSIAYGINNITAGLEFDNYLYIVYNKKKAPDLYVRSVSPNTSKMESELSLLQKITVEVEANGNYSPLQSLLNSGYWGWSEKISTLLPFDYNYVK